MIKLVYFDEGEYQKEWNDLINRSTKLGYEMIAVKSLDQLFDYLGHTTLIYTVPKSIKDWMKPRTEGEVFNTIIIGPDRGALSTWLNKNKEKTHICKFRYIDGNNSNVRSAFKIGRIILNGR